MKNKNKMAINGASFVPFLSGICIFICITIQLGCDRRIPVVTDVTTVRQFSPDIVWGGTTVAVAQNPSNSLAAIAGSAAGGFFRTDDGGAHWQLLEDILTTNCVDVEFCPYDSNIVIATTAADNRRVNMGGIWLSVDGGRRWTKPANYNPPLRAGYIQRCGGWGIAFDPYRRGRVYVGTDYGLATSSDLGRSWTHTVIDSTLGANYDKTQDRVFSIAVLPSDTVIVSLANSTYLRRGEGEAWSRSASAQPAYGGPFTLSSYNAGRNFTFYMCSNGRTAGPGMLYSVNGGDNWREISLPGYNWNAPPFVRVGKTARADVIRIYYGNGFLAYRGDFLVQGDLLALQGNWVQLFIEHVDPMDVCLTADSMRISFMACHGGPLKPVADNNDSLLICGTAINGFYGLEGKDIQAQVVNTDGVSHVDLYFATWDNSLWASMDGGRTWPNLNIGGEGYYIQAGRPEVDRHDDSIVIGRFCAGCRYAQWGAHLQPLAGNRWTQPASQGALAMPQYVNRGTYVQTGIRTGADGRFIDDTVMVNLSGDFGNMWNVVSRVRGNMQPNTLVAGPPENRIMYYPVKLGNDSSMFYKFVFNNATLTSSTLIRPRGLGSVINWDDYWVMAIDPFNTQKLLAADKMEKCMKSSTDGGLTWNKEQALTNQLTDNGYYDFIPYPDLERSWLWSNNSAVTCIAYNPFHAGHAVIATRYNGVFQTRDGGTRWVPIPESKGIHHVTRIAFDKTSMFLSSDGSGLWKITNDTAWVDFPIDFAPYHEGPFIIDPILGTIVSIRDFRNPDYCPICDYVFIEGGDILDIKLSGRTVNEIMISGGALKVTDSKLNVKQLSIPYSVTKEKKFLVQSKHYDKFSKKGGGIKMLQLEGGELKNIILYDNDILWFAKDRVLSGGSKSPSITVSPREGLLNTIKPGESASVQGFGFVTPKSTGERVDILVDGVASKNIAAKLRKDGSFSAKFVTFLPPGKHIVTAVLANDKSVKASTLVDVRPMD